MSPYTLSPAVETAIVRSSPGHRRRFLLYGPAEMNEQDYYFPFLRLPDIPFDGVTAGSYWIVLQRWRQRVIWPLPSA